MFAVKDIESLKNLASILVIPLFAAAIITDNSLTILHDPSLDWLRDSTITPFRIAGWMGWLLLVVATVSIAFFAIDWCVTWLHVRLGDTFVMPWLAFASLTAGLFVFGHVVQDIPKSPLNPFWHFGFIAYGLSLIERAARK